ncbi:LOW QUALITY PROTEIN: lymphocyte transmembrane adapter 1 [Rhynchonycteris naso]
MDVVTPTLSEIRQRTSDPSTVKVTLSRLNRDKDHSSSIFSGFAGLLAVFLVIVVLCGLWNWNKRKKRRIPYLQVTIMPLLTVHRSRQRAKNIYELLPRRQEELGRHQSRSLRIFSIESLLSRNSDSPPSMHVPSQAHRAQTHAVDIYDNAAGPQVCGNLTPSAHYTNVRASGDDLSISSEDSRDYVNVPTAEEIAETLASANNTPGNFFALSITQELEFTEERGKGWDNYSDCTSFWSPRTKNGDPLSDEEGSSLTSHDYVNMAELDLGAIQEKQPWIPFQGCRNYENVLPANPNGSQQEEVTSNTNHVENRTDGLETQVQLVMQSGRFLVLGDYEIYQRSAQSKNSQMKHGQEMLIEDSNDYDIDLVANKEAAAQQHPDTWLLPDELRSAHPARKPHVLVYPAGSK